MPDNHRYTRRKTLTLASAGLALGLAGCNSGYQSSASTPTPTVTVDATAASSGDGNAGAVLQPAQNVEVRMRADDSGFRFDPGVAYVKQGGTVTWTVESGTHTTTAYHPDNDRPLRIPDGARAWDSGMLSPDTESTTTVTDGTEVVDIGPGGEFVFTPGTDQPLEISAGTTVEFVWKSSGHNIVVADQPQEANWTGHETIEDEGYTYSHTFDTPGTYEFYCDPHRSLGMTGTIVVTDTEGQETTTTDQSTTTFSHTFETAGVYDYFCIPHESMGMVGTVVVGDPNPETQPGLAPPQDSLPAEAQAKLESLNAEVISLLENGDTRQTKTPGATDTSTATPETTTTPTATPTMSGTTEAIAVAPGGEFVFAPGTDQPLEIVAGTTVEFVWKSSGHNVVVADQPQEATWTGHEPIEDEGYTYSHTFDTPGTYEFYCDPHRSLGMTGTIIVTGSDGSGQNTTTAQSNDTASGSTQQTLPAEATVEMVETDDGYAFDPGVVHVEIGGTVTWKSVNDAHTTTAYHPGNDRPLRLPDGAASWDSGMLSQGETFSHTFDTPGVYDYLCIPHESMGMVGSVVVGNPDPANQPGLAPPQSSLDDDAAAALRRLNAEAESLLTSDEASGDDNQAGETTGTGGIILSLRNVEGELTPGERVTLVVTFRGDRLSGATVSVGGEDAGTTNSDGELTFVVPAETFSLELEYEGDSGSIEIEIEYGDG